YPTFLRTNFGNMTLTNAGTAFPLRPVGFGVLTATGGSTNFAATLPAAADAPLAALPPAALPAGQWTWSGSGGDYPAASLPFTVPTPIRVAGSVPLALLRTQDQTVAWNGAAF